MLETYEVTTVAAHGLLVALDTAAELRDEGRARQADRGVRARKSVGKERVHVAGENLGKVDRLGLRYAVSKKNVERQAKRLTDWTWLQHWRSPLLQVLTGAGTYSVSE